MFRIGRHSGNDFVLSDRASEDFHCEIFLHDGVYWIEDKQTRYGTLVNGKRIEKSPLNLGDELQIGFTRIDWEELLGLKTAHEQASISNVNQDSSPDSPSYSESLVVSIEFPEVKNTATRLKEDENEQRSNQVTFKYETDPYTDILSPTLTKLAHQQFEAIETDIPPLEKSTDTKPEIGELVSAELQPIALSNSESKIKAGRKLKEDERLMLLIIGIMVLMMLVGLAIGHATRN